MRLFGIFIHRPGGIDSAKRKRSKPALGSAGRRSSGDGLGALNHTSQQLFYL